MAVSKLEATIWKGRPVLANTLNLRSVCTCHLASHDPTLEELLGDINLHVPIPWSLLPPFNSIAELIGVLLALGPMTSGAASVTLSGELVPIVVLPMFVHAVGGHTSRSYYREGRNTCCWARRT